MTPDEMQRVIACQSLKIVELQSQVAAYEKDVDFLELKLHTYQSVAATWKTTALAAKAKADSLESRFNEGDRIHG